MADFKNRLRDLRKQLDLSQQDIATKLAVSKQTISQYERGVRTPDLDNLLALCDIFNVSSDYLLGKTDVTLRLLTSGDLKKLNSPDDLSREETTLLDDFRSLNDTGKQEVRNHMNYALSQERFRKDTELSENMENA